MQQLEIKYFFPLTEQIPLDLDYTPCIEFQNAKNASVVINNTGLVLSVANGGTTWASVSNIQPSFCIDIDQTPLTVMSKNKPNIFRKYLYKIMGVKWKAK
jgi:hypothetical protein